MAQMKLFEITLKYFICADTKDRAEQEIRRRTITNYASYASMELKEIRTGFTYLHSSDEEDIQF